MQIYAHRGASATHLENTLEAFAEAIRLRVDGIELDVHGTSDGTPVILHDRLLKRTGGQDVDVDALSFAELRNAHPHVPTLAEVLHMVGPAAHLDIEIKDPGMAEQTLATLAEVHDVRWSISCFDWDVLRACRSLCPRADLWLLGLAWSPLMQKTASEIGAVVVALYDKSVDESVVTAVHESGLQIMVWTVNDPDRAAELRTWGVDHLCTDNPAGMMNRLK